MKITLKDGSVKEYSEAKSVYDIAADISERTCKSCMCRRSEWRGRRSSGQ